MRFKKVWGECRGKMITTTNDNSELFEYILLVTAVVAAVMLVIALFVVLFVVAADIFKRVRKLQKPPFYSKYNYLISATYRNFCRPAIPPPKCGQSFPHSSRTNRRRERNNCVCRFSWKCRTCIQDCLSLWRRGRCVKMCAIARFNSLLMHVCILVYSRP